MGFSGPKAALGMPLRDFAECDQRPSYRAAHGVRRLIQGMPEVQKETQVIQWTAWGLRVGFVRPPQASRRGLVLLGAE